MSAKVHVGTSGFYYDHWRGLFYPEDLSKRKWLAYYIEHFDTLELNSTFYHLPKAKSIEHWEELAKEGFTYSLKAPRTITHYKKLKDAKDNLYAFLHLIKPLKSHLGVILFQLPPSLHKDEELLAAFCHDLPRGYRYAFEFRHASWYDESLFELLHRYDIALCIHDFEKKETPKVMTAHFGYVRFHGTNGRYAGEYGKERLQPWAEWIKEQGREFFCYFNNDFEGAAVRDAMGLKELLEKA